MEDPCKCKKGSGNARLVFCIQSCVSTDPCSSFWQRILKYYEQPLAIRESADVFVRQARAYDERQMGKLLAPSRFQYTPGIEAAPVVDRRNATVCIVDKLSGFSMPMFKVVMKRGAHAFKVHEKEELPGVSNAELEELLATARAPGGNVVV